MCKLRRGQGYVRVGDYLYQMKKQPGGYLVRPDRGHWRDGFWHGPFEFAWQAAESCEVHARTGFFAEVKADG
jgi:hypothetical protein